METCWNWQNGSTNRTELPSPEVLYEDEHADTVFSYEVLETLSDAELASALEEGLRVANVYVFMVPTIAIIANTLKGNEHLRSVDEWVAFIEREGHQIKEYKEFDNGGYVIFVIT